MASKERKCSVLIVEDDQLALSLMQEAVRLKFPNLNVYAAANGKAGLELYSAIQPEVVVTDAMMPELNGIEMIRSIKSTKADTKVIMVTGFTDLAGKGEAEQLLDHLLFKPVDYEKMFAAIDSCVVEMCG